MSLQRRHSSPTSTGFQLAAIAVAVLCPWLAVSVPLSDWHSGIATNYGGAQDGMNPYDPSFGTKEVGLLPSACAATMILMQRVCQTLRVIEVPSSRRNHGILTTGIQYHDLDC
jgi:hypothetical protein